MVRGYDHRQLRVDVRESGQRREQDLAPGQVETGSRLVEQQESRLADERSCDERPLPLPLGAVTEAPFGERPEPERSEERVRPVDVEHAETVLEVADRAGRAGPHDLTYREHRGEAVAVPVVDEPDPLPQAGRIGAPHRLAEYLDLPPARELRGGREREQRCLARAVSAEERPALARSHRPGDVVEERFAGATRLVPAPDADTHEAERKRCLTACVFCLYTY